MVEKEGIVREEIKVGYGVEGAGGEEDRGAVKAVEASRADNVGQEQIHDLLFGEKLSWQSIIYDLINTEQLNPWDVDICLLANKYLEKVKELEEANFFVSSKVLFAASLLLRIKSEIVLNRDLPVLDDILFGKKEQKSSSQERIELDEDIPELVPRTPLPRLKKVTLQELMSALGKAIKTENRRIEKEINVRRREKEVDVVIPKNVLNLKEKISGIYGKLKTIFSGREERLAFSELFELHGEEDKIAAFVSLLHLDNQQKVWLEQDGHFEEIWILLKSLYEKKNKALLEVRRKEAAKAMEEEFDALDELEKKHEEESEGGFEEKGSGVVDTGFSHSEIEGEIE